MMPHMQYWPSGSQRQQQQMAVNTPRHQDLNFQHYLHAQLANWRPFVKAHQQPTQLQTRHALPHGRLPRQRATMDSKADVGGQTRLWPDHDDHLIQQINSNTIPRIFHPQPEHFSHMPSFFNDEIEYCPEEATLFNPEADEQAQHLSLQGLDTLTLPFTMPDTAASSTNVDQDFKSSQANRFDHGRVTTYVDTAQYQPVRREDWNRASIDFDDEADSPASLDTYSNGPFTPVAAEEDGGSFMPAVPRFSDELASSFDSNSSSIHHANHYCQSTKAVAATDCKPSATSRLTGHHSSNANGLLYTGLPVAPHQVMPFDHYTTEPTADPAFLFTPHSEVTRTLLSNAPPSGSSQRPTFATRANTRVPKVEGGNHLLTESGARRQRDDYLLEMRDRGLSYREIKRRGKFREAESTLRGRVRVLTKDKSERVRRPEWTDMDVHLLRRAVAVLAKRRDSSAYARSRECKVPWKRISTWIKENGGSYLFAPATCAKKWEEIGGR